MKRRAFLLAVPAVVAAQTFLPNSSSANILSTKEKEDVLLRMLLECNGVPDTEQPQYHLEVTHACIQCEGQTTDHCLVLQPYYISSTDPIKNFISAAVFRAPFGEIEDRDAFVYFAYESLMDNQNIMGLPANNG